MSFSLQVAKACTSPTPCRSDCSELPSILGSFSEYSGSHPGGFAQSHYSKPYVMCTATDAASAIMDFSKQKVDDGVVDSPPERRAGITPVASPSPLKRMCSFVEPKTDCTPQRKLYVDAGIDVIQVKEADPIASNLIPLPHFPVQPSSTPTKERRFQSSRSQGTIGVRKPPTRSTSLHTQSVGLKPRPLRSASTQFRRNSLFLNGGDGTGDDSGQCHQSSLRGMVYVPEVDAYFKPYSRRKEIMAGYAKVKGAMDFC